MGQLTIKFMGVVGKYGFIKTYGVLGRKWLKWRRVVTTRRKS